MQIHNSIVCTCGKSNLLCPLHPPEMGMREDFNDSMELVDSAEISKLRAERAAWHKEREALRGVLRAIVDSANNGNEPGQTWWMIAGGMIALAEEALTAPQPIPDQEK